MATQNCRHLLFGNDRSPATEEALNRILAQPESHRVMQDLFKVEFHPPRTKTPMLVMGGGREIGLPVSLFESQARFYACDLKIHPDLVHEALIMEQWKVLANSVEA